ncbi:rCG37756 [Rattus norvegicus]|uniref:RCG37756 n=1 Tax=Rattus norvegicus TaxID=10116 RepID=A6JEV1_RAT|nr:rCG37756 [Rattus norvegicus]
MDAVEWTARVRGEPHFQESPSGCSCGNGKHGYPTLRHPKVWVPELVQISETSLLF